MLLLITPCLLLHRALIQLTVQIVAAQPLKAGQEVFNCYGEHGNPQLVCKYGFALQRNPFNVICLSKDALLGAAAAHLTPTHLSKRRAFLEGSRCEARCTALLCPLPSAENGSNAQ